MGMGFAPTWLRRVSPLLHMTTLTTDGSSRGCRSGCARLLPNRSRPAAAGALRVPCRSWGLPAAVRPDRGRCPTTAVDLGDGPGPASSRTSVTRGPVRRQQADNVDDDDAASVGRL